MRKSLSIPAIGSNFCWAGSYEIDEAEQIVRVFNEAGDLLATVPIAEDGAEAAAKRELMRPRNDREWFSRPVHIPDVPY
jgi:hypothetical protein